MIPCRSRLISKFRSRIRFILLHSAWTAKSISICLSWLSFNYANANYKGNTLRKSPKAFDMNLFK